MSLDAVDIFLASVSSSTGPIYNITGTDKHRKRGHLSARIWTKAGLILVVIGTALQLVATIFAAK